MMSVVAAGTHATWTANWTLVPLGRPLTCTLASYPSTLPVDSPTIKPAWATRSIRGFCTAVPPPAGTVPAGQGTPHHEVPRADSSKVCTGYMAKAVAVGTHATCTANRTWAPRARPLTCTLASYPSTLPVAGLTVKPAWATCSIRGFCAAVPPPAGRVPDGHVTSDQLVPLADSIRVWAA